MPLVAPLVALGTWALVMWVLATALAIAVIAGYISGVLQGLPFPLNKLAGLMSAVAHAITSACGKLESGIDHLIGAAWHALARYMDKLWSQIEAQAGLAAHEARLLGDLLYAHLGFKAAVQSIKATATAAWHLAKRLEREYRGIEAKVRTLEREIGKGIGNDVRAQIKALDTEITGIEQGVIPQLQAGIKAAEGEVTQLENFVKAIPGTSYFKWAAGIVTAALGVEAFNLLKCGFLRNLWNNRGCGLWNGIDDLLGLFIDAFLFTNICELLPLFETLVSDVATPLVIGLTDIGAGLCDGGIGAAPPLAVPALSLPANPGVTLNLP